MLLSYFVFYYYAIRRHHNQESPLHHEHLQLCTMETIRSCLSGGVNLSIGHPNGYLWKEILLIIIK